MPASSPPSRRRPYLKSGVYALRKAVVTLGSRALPSKSTALGRALHEWRTSLVADLGGPDAVSTHGRHPTLVIYDEVGWARDEELFSSLLAGQASVEDPLCLWSFSTTGAARSSSGSRRGRTR